MWREIQPEALKESSFQLIGKDWTLVSAKAGDKVNTMTASWGGLGVMWGKNAAFIVLRPQRYTKELVDQSERFTLSFLPESYRKTLSYLGSVSGRDEDKVTKSGLTVLEDGGAPYFAEAKLVLVCRKMYAQQMGPDCMLDSTIDGKWYPNHDYHTLYIGEVEKALIQQ